MGAAADLDVWLHFGTSTSPINKNPTASWEITDEIEHISFTYGRDGANPLTGDIVAGSCQITVRNDNDDWSSYNASGAYYSGTSRPWIGRLLIVNFSGDSESSIGARRQQAWLGYVVSVKPTVVLSPTGGKIKRAIINARGPLMYAARQAFMTRKFGESHNSYKTTSNCLRGMLSDTVSQSGLSTYYMYPPQDSELLAGIPNPERFIGKRIPERMWVKPGESYLSAARRLADFEGGDLIEARNLEDANDIVGLNTFFMQAGDYRTKWQYAIAPEDSLLFTDEARADLDATDIPIQYIELINTTDDIYNHVECEVASYEAGSTEVLWTLPEANTTDGTAPFLAMGESVIYTFTYPSELASAGVVGVDSFTTPLAEPTDLDMNSLPDGTGSSLNSNGFAAVSWQGVNRVQVTVNNISAAGGLYITKLQVRGAPLIKNASTVISAKDSTSIAAYGIRTYRRKNDLETNVEEAQSWVARTLARYKDPRPALKLVFSPNYSDNAALAGYRIQVGDRIEVKANATDGCGLGFQEYFYVERISHDITWPETGEKNWRCEFLCSWTPPLVALTGNQPASTGTLTPVGP